MLVSPGRGLREKGETEESVGHLFLFFSGNSDTKGTKSRPLRKQTLFTKTSGVQIYLV